MSTKALILFLMMSGSFVIKANASTDIPDIPNRGFELWSGSPEKPDGWGVLNFSFLTFINFNSATKSIDSYSGTYALQLESKSFTLPPPFNIIPIPPLAGSAVADTSYPLGGNGSGFPFINRPTVLKGYYKYIPAGLDTAKATVVLTRWNSVDLKRDTIAIGSKIFRNTVSSYTLFTVLIDYISTLSPDSANISFSSSPTASPKNGSKFLIDDLGFFPTPTGTLSIDDNVEYSNAVSIFPNPCQNILNISLNDMKGKYQCLLTNLLGDVVLSTSLRESKTSIDVSCFAQGLYLCSIVSENGTLISSQKISFNNQ